MRIRTAVAGLSISAAAFVGMLQSEGFSSVAIIPTIGDRPTVGFGSTFYEDGSPVKMGDKITPQRAVQLAHNHTSKEEQAFRASLPNVALFQEEYDLYLDFVYQFGMGNWNKSAMRKNLLAGNYIKACAGLLQYRYSAGFDCSTPGNKRCWGVWDRQKKRYEKCMGAQ